MPSHSRLRALSPLLFVALTIAGCNKAGDIPEITQRGMFTVSDGYVVEVLKLGTLGNTYGPRLFPAIPEYDIPVVSYVGPIYVNLPDVPADKLKGIEWHGYRLGGNAPAGSRSTAPPQDWKSVALVTEPTKTAGIFKVVVASADAKTGRWKPESSHEYFGLMLDAGHKESPIWAVKIR
jgi:hypothetical protein